LLLSLLMGQPSCKCSIEVIQYPVTIVLEVNQYPLTNDYRVLAPSLAKMCYLQKLPILSEESVRGLPITSGTL
jgi:hypothetical protein